MITQVQWTNKSPLEQFRLGLAVNRDQSDQALWSSPSIISSYICARCHENGSYFPLFKNKDTFSDQTFDLWITTMNINDTFF